jgi:release factor glutamine methyltransferase
MPVMNWISQLCAPLRDHFSERECDNLTRWLQEDLNLSPDINNDAEIARLAAAVEQLLQGKPIQYVTGIAHFYGLILEVDQRVLIPRPETEELVYTLIKHFKSISKTPQLFLDIGTGSGCIALALKKAWPKTTAFACDISSDALDVARANGTRHAISVEWILCDILDRKEWDKLPGEIPLIISNPPYIPESEKKTMDRHVVENEPHTALFTRDHTGLEFYEAIADLAVNQGSRDALVCCELNEFRAEATSNLFKERGFSVHIEQDLQGKPRILLAQKTP